MCEEDSGYVFGWPFFFFFGLGLCRDFFLRTLAVVFALFGVFALMCCFLEVLVWWGFFFPLSEKVVMRGCFLNSEQHVWSCLGSNGQRNNTHSTSGK